MPARCASAGDLNATARPSKTMLPRSALYAPVRILISVDLPAPFWPMSARTSPRPTDRLAAESAGTPANALSVPGIERSGARAPSAPGIACADGGAVFMSGGLRRAALDSAAARDDQ